MSFLGYVLQIMGYTFNMVACKSVPKTPFELWTG